LPNPIAWNADGGRTKFIDTSINQLVDLRLDFLDPFRKRKGEGVRHSTSLQQPASGILRAYGHLICFADELPAIKS
jgi:hypothetical protein